MITRGADLRDELPNWSDPLFQYRLPYVELRHGSLINSWATGKQWINTLGKDKQSLQRQLRQAVVDSSPNERTSSAHQTTATPATAPLQFTFAYLWDTNPKLVQIIQIISDSSTGLLQQDPATLLTELLEKHPTEFQDRFLDFWSTCQEQGEFPDLSTLIIDGYSGILLHLFLWKGPHWLNLPEMAFVEQSWAERIKDILELRRERDEARSAALAAKARQLYQEDHTLGLNLSRAAHKKYPSDESRAAIHDIISNPKSQFYLAYKARGTVAFAFSPDGKRLLTGSDDQHKRATIWDIKGECLYRIKHSSWVKGVAYSPDGEHILTVANHGKFFIRNKNGELLNPVDSHPPSFAAFLPHFTSILSKNGNTRTPNLWDLDGKPINSFNEHSSSIRTLAISPDGTSILTGSSNGTVSLWELDGTRIWSHRPHSSSIRSLVFSPDGQTMLSGGWDHKVVHWQLDGSRINTFNIGAIVTHLAFSPDGNSFFLANQDGSCAIYNFAGEIIHALEKHTRSIQEVAFSPDGTSMFTRGVHTDVTRLYDSQGTLLHTFEGIFSMTYSADGKLLLGRSQYDRTSALWDLNGNPVRTFNSLWGSPTFAPDEKSVFFPGSLKLVHWNLEGKSFWEFDHHTDRITDLAFSPDGQNILTGSKDQTAILWDLQGNLITIFEGHTNGIHAVAFSPDGQSVLTGSFDQTIRIWSLDDASFQSIHVGSAVTDALFSPDGQTILSNGPEQTVNLWDLSGNLTQSFKVGNVSGLAFSPDGQKILTGIEGDYARLWDLQGNNLLDLTDGDEIVHAVAFSPDGQTILSGNDDLPPGLWSLDGQQLQTFGDWGTVYDVAFSMDGQYILIASYAGEVTIWDLAGNRIQSFPIGTPVYAAVFSPDGKSILVTASNNTARIHKLFYSEWEDGTIWDRVHKLSENERQEDHKIDWDYYYTTP